MGEHEPVKEAQEGRGAVEGEVAAEEAGVADDAEQPLAHDGGAEEVLGLVRREPEEDLCDDVVDEVDLRRRRRRRRHGALAGGVSVGFGRNGKKRRARVRGRAYLVRFDRSMT